MEPLTTLAIVCALPLFLGIYFGGMWLTMFRNNK